MTLLPGMRRERATYRFGQRSTMSLRVCCGHRVAHAQRQGSFTRGGQTRRSTSKTFTFETVMSRPHQSWRDRFNVSRQWSGTLSASLVCGWSPWTRSQRRASTGGCAACLVTASRTGSVARGTRAIAGWRRRWMCWRTSR